ncbi:MAG: hypothetical protein ABIP94_12725 [Planctomycetota bacterium]
MAKPVRKQRCLSSFQMAFQVVGPTEPYPSNLKFEPPHLAQQRLGVTV